MPAVDDLSSGPFYHGTKADLKNGDLLAPGYNSNYGTRKNAKYVYLTATLEAATWGAELAVGALTVAGVTKTNTMAVTIEKLEGSKLKVTGKTALKMTEFGISPPAPDIGLGLIKTSDDVQLTFTWVAEPKKGP